MSHTQRMVLCVVLAVSSAARGGPPSAVYSEDPDQLVWFLVITDTHIGEQLLGGDQDTNNLTWLLGEAAAAVEPAMIVNCGDLVDATNGGLVPTGQHDQEWSLYRSIVDAAGMTTSRYLDIPGNHDQYSDKGLTHYLTYSLAGSADGQTQHSVVVEAADGPVHLLGTATPGNDGAPFPLDNASLDGEELGAIEAALTENDEARLQIAFGHHPIDGSGLFGDGVGEGAGVLRDLLDAHQVGAYVFGHTHDYVAKYEGGLLEFNIRSLGKSGDQNVGLMAVDNGLLVARAFKAGTWPFVMITAPADVDFGGGNPHAYSAPPGWEAAPVRALVFAASAPDAVELRLDGPDWLPMEEVAPHVWQGAMDTTGMSAGKYPLRVRARPWDVEHQIVFRVAPTACSNGIDDDLDGTVDYPEDPGCASPADGSEEGEVPPEPDPEPAEETADNGIGAELEAAEAVGAEAVGAEAVGAEAVGADTSEPPDLVESEPGKDTWAGASYDADPGADPPEGGGDAGNRPAVDVSGGSAAHGDDAAPVAVPGHDGAGCAAAGAPRGPGAAWMAGLCLIALAGWRRRARPPGRADPRVIG